MTELFSVQGVFVYEQCESAAFRTEADIWDMSLEVLDSESHKLAEGGSRQGRISSLLSTSLSSAFCDSSLTPFVAILRALTRNVKIVCCLKSHNIHDLEQNVHNF